MSLDRQADEFRHQLGLDRQRLEISYGGIYEKQANAILEMYALLLDVGVRTESWLMDQRSVELTNNLGKAGGSSGLVDTLI